MSTIDPIDTYLDEVCKLLPFAQSDEKMAEGWRKVYGIDVSADAFAALPEKFKIMIETSRSEREALRNELREHLDASVARIEVGGIDRDAAVKQAIAEFGNAKRLNSLLRREFTGTVKQRVRKVLDDHDRAQTKQSKLVGFWWTCVRLWPLIGSVAIVTGEGRASSFKLSSVLLVFVINVIGGFYNSWRTRTGRRGYDGMRSIIAAPDLPNRTMKQRAMSWFIRSLINTAEDRRSPSIVSVLRSLAIRSSLVAFVWLCPLMVARKVELTYYCLAFLGDWLGELSAGFLENRRTSAA